MVAVGVLDVERGVKGACDERVVAKYVLMAGLDAACFGCAGFVERVVFNKVPMGTADADAEAAWTDNGVLCERVVVCGDGEAGAIKDGVVAQEVGGAGDAYAGARGVECVILNDVGARGREDDGVSADTSDDITANGRVRGSREPDSFSSRAAICHDRVSDELIVTRTECKRDIVCAGAGGGNRIVYDYDVGVVAADSLRVRSDRAHGNAVVRNDVIAS